MTQILNVSSLVSKPVDLVTAGDDQVAICEPIVYLEATVNGDLSYHHTLWEQISGTPTVTLVNVTATQSYYTVPGAPGTDKVFRFWIDKDTPFQLYRDVTIRTTPATNARTFSTGTGGNDSVYPDYALISRDYVLAAVPFDYNIPNNSQFSMAGIGTTLMIPEPSYTRITPDDATLSYSTRYAGSIAQQWSGITWNTIATFTAGDAKQITIDLPARLRFGVVYHRPGREDEVAFHPWNDYDGLGTAQEVYSQPEVGLIGNDVAIDRVVYRRVAMDNDETAVLGEVGLVAMDFTVSRIVYRLEILTGIDETPAQYEVGLIHNSFTVTRIAGGNLGG